MMNDMENVNNTNTLTIDQQLDKMIEIGKSHKEYRLSPQKYAQDQFEPFQAKALDSNGCVLFMQVTKPVSGQTVGRKFTLGFEEYTEILFEQV